MTTNQLTRAFALAVAALAPAVAFSQPVAQLTLTAPATPIRGQAFTLDVDVTNSGTATGFAPAVELFLPATVTFVSATSLGQPLVALANTTTAPLLNPLTAETVLGPAGSRFVLLRLPVNHVPAGATRRLSVTLNTVTTATLDAAISLQATALFAYGATPLNDPQVDLPVRSDLATSAADQTVRAVAPAGAVITGRVERVTPAGVVVTDIVTGSRTPVEVVYELDAFAGSTLSNATLSIPLPDAFQLISATAIGGGTVVTVPAAPAASPGGSVTVSYSAGIAGVAGVDRTVRVRGFISQNRASGAAAINPTTLTPITIAPQATLSSVTLPTPVSGQASLRGHAVLLRETLSPSSPVPGDVVTVTQIVEQSDFFATSANDLTTTLAPGLTYTAASSTPLTPVIAGNTLTFAVGALAQVATGATAPVTSTNTFTVSIEQAYPSAGPVFGSDRLTTVNSLVSAAVGGGTRTQTEAASGSDGTIVVAAPTLGVTTRIGGSAATTVKAGDVVTFRLSSTLVSGDHDGEVIALTFPSPLFSVAALSSATFGGALVRYGPNASSGLPTAVTVAANAATNTLTLTFPRISGGAAPTTVEVDVDVTATAEPIDDGLLVVTPTLSTQTGTAQTSTRAANPALTVQAPTLRALVGAFASATTDAAFTPAPTVTLPSPLTSTNLSSLADSNVAQVHALSTVDVRLVVENRGSLAAANARVKLALPAGLTGALLTAIDGTGAAAATSGDLFGPGLDFTDPIAAASPSAGLNLRVVTARVTVAVGLAPRFDLLSTGQIERFASAAAGPNFVGNPALTADRVTVTTRNASAAVTSTVPNVTATIGETFTYAVSGVVPNGATIASLPVTLTLPAQLAFVSASALSASPGITCGGAACSLAVPAVTNQGRDVTFTFLDVANADTDISTPEQLGFTATVVVNNVAASVASTTGLNISTSFSGQTSTTGPGNQVRIIEPSMSFAGVTTSSDGGVLADGGSVIDSNDLVTVTVPMRVAAATINGPAREPSLIVNLPVQLTAEPGSLAIDPNCPAPTSQSLIDAGISVAFSTLPPGDAGICDVSFVARVGQNITFGQQLSPLATLTWSSLTGVVSTPVSTFSTTTTERTGNFGDPGGTANTYRITGTGPVRMVTAAPADWALISTSNAATADNLLTVGEDLVLRFRVTLAEGTHPNLSFAITPPATLGVRRVELDTATPGFTGVIANPAALTPAGASGVLFAASFGAVTVPGDNLASNNQLDLLVTLRNNALSSLTSGAVQGVTRSAGVPIASTSNFGVLLAAPRPRLTTAVDNASPSPDAGVTLTATVTNLSVTSVPDGGGLQQTSPACNLPVTIATPSGLFAQSPAADGLDNDGNGTTDDAPEAALLTGSTFSFNTNRCLNGGEQQVFRALFRTSSTLQGVPLNLETSLGDYLTAAVGGTTVSPLTDAFDTNGNGSVDEASPVPDRISRLVLTPNVPRLNFTLIGRNTVDAGLAVVAGDVVRWTARLINTGVGDLTNVRLSLPLSARTTVVPGSSIASQGTVDEDAGLVDVNVGTIAGCPPLADGGPGTVCTTISLVVDARTSTLIADDAGVEAQAVLVADAPFSLLLSDDPATTAPVDPTRVRVLNTPDIDGDGVFNGADRVANNGFSCSDLDGDGCDDCAVTATQQPGNDGPDDDATRSPTTSTRTTTA